MQDSFGRVSEKNKEALKMSKHLTKLFPNKVTIETPQVCYLCSQDDGYIKKFSFARFNSENMLQDETELSQWKQRLDRDVEILKAKANVLKIQSVSLSLR